MDSGVTMADHPAATAGFRPDIDGLRAVAILLVVAYHAEVPGFGGGFVGVDVFFVISGFLITRQLLAESQRTGRVRLLGFWARRIRRLVPALAVMVVVTVALAYLVLPALGMDRVVSDAQRSLLYVSNFRFAGQANDYFANDLDPSVYLHTWSLGIEEQFYLVWPVLVLSGVLLGGRVWGRSSKRVLAALFGLITVASLAWCITVTGSNSARAFYLLPSRAWEFALAAFLACLPLHRLTGPAMRRAMSVGGLAAIAGAAATMGKVTGYPGAWPLLPVLGTAALITAGSIGPKESPTGLIDLLGRRGPQWLGRLSYSWYLWHWPLIVLGVKALDQDNRATKAALAALALVIAWLAHVTVENPVRFATRIKGSQAFTYGLAGVITLVALGGVAVVGNVAARKAQSGPLAGLADVREQRRDFTCAREMTSPAGIEYCEDGDLGAKRTVLLMGDSHVRHWKPAFAAAAQQEGIRLLIRWRGACPSIEVSTVKLKVGGRDVECDRFRADTKRLIDELSPDAVVRSDSHQYIALLISPDDRKGPELWADQLRRSNSELRKAGIRTGIVADSPSLPFDPVDCLAENGDGPACEVTRAEGYKVKEALLSAEHRVEARDPELKVFDITSTLCGRQLCPLVIDRTYVYSDKDHLTEPFVLSQVNEVRAFLRDLMA